MSIKTCFLFLILVFLAAIGKSQSCTTLGQTPATAFPVCGSSTFIQNNVPICGVTAIPGPCPLSEGLTDKNPFWYRFICFSAGTLGFIIRPNNISDDYDWQLFDITGHNPNDVYTDVSLFVASNWSQITGNTGASPAGTNLQNCCCAVPVFSRMPTLLVNHEYLLLVSHWDNTQSGYQLTFTGGTAVITDPLSPAMQSINVDCGGQEINLILNKKMKCSSLAVDRSDFILSPANSTIAVNTGFGCLNNFDMDSVNIRFTSPLPPGNYTLSMANGSDANTLLDNCGTPIPVGNNIQFTVPVRPALPGPNSVTGWPTSDCIPIQIRVLFPEPVMCNSAALNGSDFVVTGPSTVTVVGIVAVCTSGETNGFTIQFAAPITVPGTYTVHIAMGTDGNTILGRCNREVTVGETAQFTIASQAPIPMGTITIDQCASSTLTLTFTDPILCNSIAANGSDFTVTGTSGVTVTGATPVNCNNGETTIITLQFSAPIVVPGNYQVLAATGSDGNTLIGQCNRQVPVGNSSAFTINAQTPIPMGAVTPPPCTPQSITLTFADPINCNSIAANGSDFIITGPSAVTVSSATPVNCNASGETTSITIQFSAPIIITGTYDVQIAAGTDGNTLIGQCNRQVTAGSTTQFTLAAQPPVAMGNVSQPPCLPTSITLTFADPIFCSSIASNGTDFVITGPSGVLITSATAVNCVNSQTTSITLQLSGPILATGTFTVQIVAGTDGNTLISQCGRIVPAGSTTQFILPPPPAIAMGTITTPPPCTPSSLTLTFADPVFCNSVAANGSDFVITGPSAVTITSATAVNCNTNGQTNTITIQFAAPILSSGTYQVLAATGSDGNTLVGQCNRQVTVGDNTTFILAPQPPIAMGAITPPNCSPSFVTLNFTDNILCNSIAANGSDFIITGPAGVIVTSATAVNCNTNGETNAITIQLSVPINVSGNFQVQMTTGSDGNTLIGNCNRRATAGDLALFTIPPASPVAMDSLVPVACSPSSLKLIFKGPIRCSSIASNGSDFNIAGSSTVNIASASGTCDANGLTTSITIQLGSPIVVGGPYQLQLVTGSDGNTLLSDCNRLSPSSSLSFTASDTVSAEFQYQIQYDCQNDAITFSHDGQHNVNQWAWTVNGAAGSTSQTFTQSFSAASQNQIQLVVSNGVCNDTYSTPIILNNKVTVDFIAPESVCPEDTVGFIEKTAGRIDNWQWTFGNGNTSVLQNPPAQIYPITGTETLYPVTLTISNTLGCQATATKTVKVLSGCIIAVPTAFTPNNDGKNDYLFPLNALKAEKLDFKVFNRWGQLVFHSTNWTQKWDGRTEGIMQATGVYVWVLNFTYRDTKQKYSMKGTTTLIR